MRHLQLQCLLEASAVRFLFQDVNLAPQHTRIHLQDKTDTWQLSSHVSIYSKLYTNIPPKENLTRGPPTTGQVTQQVKESKPASFAHVS